MFLTYNLCIANGWSGMGLGGSMGRINDLKVYGNRIYGVIDSPGDVYRSVNLSQFINLSPSFSGFVQCFSVAEINNLIFAQFSSGLYVTTNDGAGWTLLNTGDEYDGFLAPALKTFNNKLYYHLKVSADSGVTWTTLNNGILPNKTPYIFHFSDTLFLGLWYSGNTGVIYRSTNQGALWIPTSFTIPASINGEIGPAYFYKNKIYIDGGASPRPDIYVSTNGGANFYYLSSVSGRTSIESFASFQDYLFCGTDSTIMLSRNEGVSWENIGGELQNMQETPGIGLICIYQNTHIIVNYYARGLQKRLLSEFVGIGDPGSEILSQYRLTQNYPNPFNPSTTINYYIPRRETVSIKIYNPKGAEIAELVNESKASGLHIVNFDGSTLSSGVYFYRIQAGEFTETKKMLLVK